MRTYNGIVWTVDGIGVAVSFRADSMKRAVRMAVNDYAGMPEVFSIEISGFPIYVR
jgi:hypothetical protein